MENGKDFFASKVTWGAVVALLAPVLRMLGVEYDAQVLVDALTTVAGGVLIVWGQFSRKKEITSIAGVEVKK